MKALRYVLALVILDVVILAGFMGQPRDAKVTIEADRVELSGDIAATEEPIVVTVPANTTTAIVPDGFQVAEVVCTNFDAADNVFIVEAGASDLTDAYGPFCPIATCTDLGGTFGSPSRQLNVRSATDAELNCRLLLQ